MTPLGPLPCRKYVKTSSSSSSVTENTWPMTVPAGSSSDMTRGL